MKILYLLLFLIVFSYNYSVTVLTYQKAEAENDVRRNYYIDVLKMVMEKTKKEYGDYQLKDTKNVMLQSRMIEEVEYRGEINIFWSMTSKEREKRLLPIRIPLVKGLLGNRVFIIRKENKELFENIKSLEDLKKYRAGQGYDWPDVEILEYNGLKVEKASKYGGMFLMLKYKRFDYFPRGVNEVWEELEKNKNLDLILEESIMLQYYAPVYFFVNKEDKEIANRIEKGLKKAIKDGDFDKLIYSHKSLKSIFEKINLKNRRIFKLYNPSLTEESKKILSQRELWDESFFKE